MLTRVMAHPAALKIAIYTGMAILMAASISKCTGNYSG